LRFAALNHCQPKNFEASRRKTSATAMVTHKPHIMPVMTRLKSLAPRTSPYRVAPQFGHRIQKHRNGIRRRVSPKNGENPRFGTTFAPPASLSVWAYALFTPKRFCASWLNALTNPAREPNSITRNMIPSPMNPM
jgi:hypothetical protein